MSWLSVLLLGRGQLYQESTVQPFDVNTVAQTKETIRARKMMTYLQIGEEVESSGYQARISVEKASYSFEASAVSRKVLLCLASLLPMVFC